MTVTNEFILANLDRLAYIETIYERNILGSQNLRRSCPLGNHLRLDHGPGLSLGLFDALPNEVLQVVFLDLDLQSLARLCSVSSAMRRAVGELKQYDDIIRYASNSLRGVLAIEVGSSITLRQFYERLCSSQCTACGRFGALLYLLTCSRVCDTCYALDSRFLPVTPYYAQTAYGLSATTVNTFPKAKSIPGAHSYSPPSQSYARAVLVDSGLAEQAGTKLHGSKLQMELYVKEKKFAQWDAYKAHVASPAPGSRAPPLPLQVPAPYESTRPLRSMCIVRFPWLNHSRFRREWGLNCQGCRDEVRDGTEANPRIKRTLEDFLRHVRVCPNSAENLISWRTVTQQLLGDF